MAKRGALVTILFATLVLLSAGTLSCARPAEQAQLTALPHGTCSISGKITDENGDAVVGATVTIDVHPRFKGFPFSVTDLAAECTEKKLAITRTDSRGHYAIYGMPVLPVGSYLHLQASAASYVDLNNLFQPTSFQHFRWDLHFTPGETLPTLGNPPSVDPKQCGGRTVVSPDPKTGIPLAYPQ